MNVPIMNTEQTLKSKYFIPANELLAEGKIDEAIALAQAAIQEYSNNANAYRLQGIVHDRAGNLEEAISGYWKAIELDPAFSRAYAGLAMTYALAYQLGWEDEAALNRVVEQVPGFDQMVGAFFLVG